MFARVPKLLIVDKNSINDLSLKKKYQVEQDFIICRKKNKFSQMQAMV